MTEITKPPSKIIIFLFLQSKVSFTLEALSKKNQQSIQKKAENIKNMLKYKKVPNKNNVIRYK